MASSATEIELNVQSEKRNGAWKISTKLCGCGTAGIRRGGKSKISPSLLSADESVQRNGSMNRMPRTRLTR
ncbi:MAG TPA: hypothetical protein VGL23_00665 [Chloroflexota bacterium]